MNRDDQYFMKRAYLQAKKSYDEGGCPIGAVLVDSQGEIVGEGHNMRVQEGNPIKHGEMEAMTRAGRQSSYTGMTMYTTLSPCMMCSGTIVQFGIARVVIGDVENLSGNEDFLKSRGVEVTVLNDPDCIALMARFIADNPVLWAEDIGVDPDTFCSAAE